MGGGLHGRDRGPDMSQDTMTMDEIRTIWACELEADRLTARCRRELGPEAARAAVQAANDAFLKSQLRSALLPEVPHVAARLAAATHARCVSLRASLRGDRP